MPKQTPLEAIGNLDLPAENREAILARAAKLPLSVQEALLEDLRVRLLSHAEKELGIRVEGFEILNGVLSDALIEDKKQQKSVEQIERDTDMTHAEKNLQISS